MPLPGMTINDLAKRRSRAERGEALGRQPPVPGGSPRSVHDCGSVIWPLNPPAQTNTVSAPRRLAYKTSSRCPFSGWNG